MSERNKARNNSRKGGTNLKIRIEFNINIINFKTRENMKKYVCDVCGYVYDPAIGDPDGGIEPGTAFEDIPEDWVCPLCGVGKDDFSLVEE